MDGRAVGTAVVKQRVIARATHRQPRRRRELVIQSCQDRVRMTREMLVDVKGRVWTVVDERLRLACEAVAAEEMDAVPDNRPAHGPTDLLIRIWQDAMGDEIWRVELVAAEVPAERARQQIGA